MISAKPEDDVSKMLFKTTSNFALLNNVIETTTTTTLHFICMLKIINKNSGQTDKILTK